MATVTAYSTDKFDADGGLFGEWLDWVPTWTSWTIGNGTVVARYKLLGKTLIFRIYIKFGSTSSFATPTPTWTLPSGITIPVGSDQLVKLRGYDGHSLMKSISGSCYIAANTGIIIGPEFDGNYITDTSPWTWAELDQICIQGELEIA